MGSNSNWQATGDFGSFDLSKVLEKRSNINLQQNKNSSISYPGTPKINQEQPLLARRNSVDEKIDKMKNLLIQKHSGDSDNQERCFAGSDFDDIEKLRKEIINQKQYLDSCIYDDMLINCLPDKTEISVKNNVSKISVVSERKSGNSEGKPTLSCSNLKLHDFSNDIANVSCVNVPKDTKNIVQNIMLELSECVGSLPADVHGGTVTSADSTRAVRKSRKKKKSIATVKDKKKSGNVKAKIVTKKCNDESKNKRFVKKVKKVKSVVQTLTPRVYRITKQRENIPKIQEVQKTKSLEETVFYTPEVKLSSMSIENNAKTSKFKKTHLEVVNEIREYDGEISTERQYVPAHYTKSTVSSRMKEVHRPNYPNFNYRYPFVVGQSTNRSHNLGVNIQQILSLLKTKRITRCSSLKPESRKMSSCAFSLQSKLSKVRHQCPAIVEQDLEEKELSEEDREMRRSQYPWDSGQKEYELANIDPSKLRPRCICMEKNVPVPNRIYEDTEDGFEDGHIGLPLSNKIQNLQFHKVKSNSSVYWASVLRQIKQYQMSLQNAKLKPSVSVIT